MKSKNIIKSSYLLLILLLAFTFLTVYAAENTDMIPKVISSNKDTGITIYQDASGGLVFSGLEVPSIATEVGQMNQQLTSTTHKNSSVEPNQLKFSMTNYVDYEYNPIYIGTWNGVDTYARHTLGSYDSSTKTLTSYGYTSWYNVGGNTAVPYRNGATNNGANQGVVDVAKFSYLSIWDMGSNKSTTLKITDWGPTQDLHPDRIADIDKSDFINLHSNSSDGIFYSKTRVPVTNYNP